MVRPAILFLVRQLTNQNLVAPKTRIGINYALKQFGAT